MISTNQDTEVFSIGDRDTDTKMSGGHTLYHAVQPCGREMDSRSSPFFYWAILNATSGGDLAREVFE